MKRSAKNKRTIIILLALALLALGVAGYIKFNQPTYKPSSTADTKVHAGPKNDTSTTPSTAQATTQTNPSHPTSSTLPKPIGPTNNVSSINLSGSTGMESVCRSVAGASCYIRATKNSTVITVSQAKLVGSDAYSDGVILNWDAKQLSIGNWRIQAVASKDGQTAASDPQSLEVKS